MNYHDAMSAAKEKFATQVTSQILAEVRAIAHSEGRQLQALVDEAFADLIEKRRSTRPRAHVMDCLLYTSDAADE